MNITIAYFPRENAYLWAHQPAPGKAPDWRRGKTTLEDTRTELEALYPQATFTIRAAQ